MTSNPLADFRRAMEEAGLAPPSDPIADSKLHRYHVEGDRRGSRNGWYVLHPDEPAAGAFGSWRTGERHTWRAQSERAFDPAEREEWRRRVEAQRRERDACVRAAAERAARHARRLWDAAGPADPSHPYLVRKQVRPHGIRQSGDKLMVPVRDTAGAIQGIQYIDGEGGKRFKAGTVKLGNYHSLGRPGDALVVVEGYATGATIYEATGYAVAVAFDAGNLRPVAEALAGKYPGAEIIIAADNDEGTEGNPGLTAAAAAARAVGGRVVAPPPERLAA